ncbi:hypothetical protein CGCFRS4_v015684 [Colletotrichum fructicola]|nr:hypothetical protein CGCFRS4_v015684 [Colletotrichum fructicola]
MPCHVFSAKEMLFYKTKIDVEISRFANIITTETAIAGKLVTGVWTLDDSEVPSGVRNIKCTATKTVIAGLITMEDLTPGEIYTATTGSVIWFPKGEVSTRQGAAQSSRRSTPPTLSVILSIRQLSYSNEEDFGVALVNVFIISLHCVNY